ncbi:hypothetical protein D3C86_2050010 [compost metagenome]
MHAFAFLGILKDFIVETQVVADVVLIQRMALDVQMSGFERCHCRLSSQISNAGFLGADPGTGRALNDSFDVRE